MSTSGPRVQARSEVHGSANGILPIKPKVDVNVIESVVLYKCSFASSIPIRILNFDKLLSS